MNVFTKLSIEADGMIGTIRSYSEHPDISNMTTKLKEYIEKKSVPEVMYLLEKISEWYKENQPQIQTNEFVFDKSDQIKNEEKINYYINELNRMNYSVTENEQNKNDYQNNSIKGANNKKRILISHSSKDKVICDAFVDFLEGLGIEEEMILYSSSSRHGIPAEMDIFDFLRDNISNGISVYYMLSDNYYKSVVCLNEMGAAWVKQNDYKTFLLPNLTVRILGVIDNKRKGFSLNESYDLIQLKNKLCDEFGLEISEGKFDKEKSRLLNVVKELTI